MTLHCFRHKSPRQSDLHPGTHDLFVMQLAKAHTQQQMALAAPTRHITSSIDVRTLNSVPCFCELKSCRVL
jgi:hypothetical protein